MLKSLVSIVGLSVALTCLANSAFAASFTVNTDPAVQTTGAAFSVDLIYYNGADSLQEHPVGMPYSGFSAFMQAFNDEIKPLKLDKRSTFAISYTMNGKPIQCAGTFKDAAVTVYLKPTACVVSP